MLNSTYKDWLILNFHATLFVYISIKGFKVIENAKILRSERDWDEL